MQIKISDAFHETAWGHGRNEDGPFEYHIGWNVIVSTVVDGLVEYRLYVGQDGGELAYVFETEESAEKFVARVRAAGEVNDAYWWHFETKDPNELPDYVLHPERPEYN